MPVTRASITDVLARIQSSLLEEATAAAGSNAALSVSEQSAMSAGVLKDAAAGVRDAKRAAGEIGRVDVSEAAGAAYATVLGLVDSVNQSSGSGGAALSQAEVRAIFATNADAGQRLARAYELITGKPVSLPSSSNPPPVTPPVTPPPATPLAFANVNVAPAFPMTFAMSVNGSSLSLSGLAQTPATVDVDVGGHHAHLDFPQFHVAFNGTGNTIDGRSIVEGVRAALAGTVDLRVASFTSGVLVVEAYPAGSAPPLQNGPIYGCAIWPNASRPGMFEMSGALAMKANTVPMSAGEGFSFRVDDKLYTATARTGSATTATLARDLKQQMEADGRTVVLKTYNGFFSLRVTA